MAAKALSEVRHVEIEGQSSRMLRLTVFVLEHDTEGARILTEVLKSFEKTIDANSGSFSSYVASTGNIQTGQTIHIAGRHAKGAKLSTWVRLKRWLRG